ncbi:DUF411 domain-containing protein [Asticcacaulis biprosthecium]|uniref:DUF411 domain-containing protein n=1 Tax=Asticcacaulis biprosthecium TaxID=76891 RepID=UPI000A06A4AC
MLASYQKPSRRLLITSLSALAVTPACAAKPTRTAIHVYRDAACGCCGAWVASLQTNEWLKPSVEIVADIASVKRRLGIPESVSSCHTATAGKFLIEGHVPAEDIVRYLSAPLEGTVGLAVPGMPIGSPGMEAPDGRRDPYDVLAFDKRGRTRVFAHHT